MEFARGASGDAGWCATTTRTGRCRPRWCDRLLEHAIRAPSAGFSQGWGFLVLEEPADRDRFWAAASPPGGTGRGRWLAGMRKAPLIVVPHANRSAYLDRYAEPDKGWTDQDADRWPVPYWHIDTGFAALLMLLTAVDEGLGACFFGIPAERIAGVPGGVRGADGVHADRGADGRLPGRGPPLAVAEAGTAPGGARWYGGAGGADHGGTTPAGVRRGHRAEA